MCSFSWFNLPVLTASLLVPSSPINTNRWQLTQDLLHDECHQAHVVFFYWKTVLLNTGNIWSTHPLVQSCSLEVLYVSWTRPEPADCSCSCRWCSSWCRPRGRSPSGSPCSNSPSCSADVQGPAEMQQAIISIIAQPVLDLLDHWQYWYLGG